jgi:hypothetical protein
MTEKPWRECIRIFFEPFMFRFFPEEAKLIDFSRGYEFLDKELEKIRPENEAKDRYADLLVKVWLYNGKEKWLLIHIEIQGYRDKHYNLRMYIYNYRIYDRYGIEVVSLSLLTDTDKNYRPGEYRMEFGKFSLSFKFPVAKLLDYQGKEEELIKDKNVFSLLILAFLGAVEKGETIDKKILFKVSLIKELYKRGYDREKILQLYKFIDWIFVLPEDATERFHEEIKKYEEEKKMTYITTAERIGIKKGIEIGIQQGIEKGIQKGIQKGMQKGALLKAQEMLQNTLTIKFGDLPEDIKAQITQINDLDKINALFEIAIRTDSLDEFAINLNGNGSGIIN